jgi:hypothetical protein
LFSVRGRFKFKRLDKRLAAKGVCAHSHSVAGETDFNHAVGGSNVTENQIESFVRPAHPGGHIDLPGRFQAVDRNIK